MNIKQGYLGLAAIVLNLLFCWLFWEIALSGGIICISAIFFNELWAEFFLYHFLLIASVICFSYELIKYIKLKLSKENGAEIPVLPVKISTSPIIKFIEPLLVEFNKNDHFYEDKFKEFGFETKEKFESLLRILQFYGERKIKQENIKHNIN